MEIEVGEYVKTNDGILGKLLRIERDDIDTSLKWYVLYIPNKVRGEVYINKPYIVKHSKNIIDLIQAGDYVNGEKVLRINDIDGKDKKIFVIFKFGETEHCKVWSNEDIKSIVTKESFASVEYKVEEAK